MQTFYGEKWLNIFSKTFTIDLYKKMWFNGLNGLNYEQIRNGLSACKKLSMNKVNNPPSVIKFYYLCLNKKYPLENVSRRTK